MYDLNHQVTEKLSWEFSNYSKIDGYNDSDKRETVFGGQIILNEGISKKNYFAAQLQQVIMVLAFTLADTLQPMILLDKGYYNVALTNAGRVNASILAVDLPVRIILAPLYGALSDHFGRRALFVYSTISLALGFFSAPFHVSIFPGYLMSRLLIVNGAICSLVLPFNADYVDNASKGRAAGIAYTVGAGGALIASLLLTFLQQIGFSLGDIYILVAFIILVTGLLTSIWLKGGNTYFKQTFENLDQETRIVRKLTFREKVELVTSDIRHNAWIIVAFLLSLLGSADFYIITTIFVLYIKSFYDENIPGAESIANQQATVLQGIFFAFAVIFCVIYGILIDKRSQARLLLVVLSTAAAAFLSFLLVTSPSSITLYLSVVLASVSLPGIFTFASFLAYRHFTAENRGIMMGISAIFGVIGVVTVMILGGYLFDNWTRNGPFLLYFMLILITLIIVLFLRSKRRITDS
jgi:MFS family permease